MFLSFSNLNSWKEKYRILDLVNTFNEIIMEEVDYRGKKSNRIRMEEKIKILEIKSCQYN